MPRKPSIEVAKAYRVSHSRRRTSPFYRIDGDGHAALRAARSLIRKGRGKVIRVRGGRWSPASALVVLRASPRTHKRALLRVSRRPGISVAQIGLLQPRGLSRQKGCWALVVSCYGCGVGAAEYYPVPTGEIEVLCPSCKKMTPMELLAMTLEH